MGSIKDVTKNIITAFGGASIRVKLVVAVTALVLVVSAVCSVLDVRFAYRVIYNGQTVGIVSTADMLSQVEDEVVANIKAENPKSYVGNARVALTCTFASHITGIADAAQKILHTDKSLVSATVLFADGTPVMAVNNSEEEVKAVLEERLAIFTSPEIEIVRFSNNLTCESAYYPAGKINTFAELSEYVSAQDVMSCVPIEYTEDIPYETEKTESSQYLKGYRRIVTEGSVGKREVAADVYFTNGVEVSREIISSVVVKEPVTQKEIIGTSVVAETKGKNINGASLLWPISSAYKTRISSYFGDGRNHKGVDICADYGVPIRAAMGGTVTFSGYKKDYGYLIVIDHGNGIQTAYGHQSALRVSAGAYVNQGDIIGNVGSTGQSYGNHVHFEVRKGNSRVNPMNYSYKY